MPASTPSKTTANTVAPATTDGPWANAVSNGRATSAKLTGHCVGVSGSISRRTTTYSSGSLRTHAAGAGGRSRDATAATGRLPGYAVLTPRSCAPPGGRGVQAGGKSHGRGYAAFAQRTPVTRPGQEVQLLCAAAAHRRLLHLAACSPRGPTPLPPPSAG
ncbi:hypothetical protein QA942_40950 [Streptomyces sp. B21-106]|uniref:hypothetical protein n=1 Tax=Streptomyces sp. B21-106 TaxID=3039418 RepID=UPI002FF22796